MARRLAERRSGPLPALSLVGGRLQGPLSLRCRRVHQLLKIRPGRRGTDVSRETRAGEGALGELSVPRRRGARGTLGRWPRVLRNELYTARAWGGQRPGGVVVPQLDSGDTEDAGKGG